MSQYWQAPPARIAHDVVGERWRNLFYNDAVFHRQIMDLLQMTTIVVDALGEKREREMQAPGFHQTEPPPWHTPPEPRIESQPPVHPALDDQLPR